MTEQPNTPPAAPAETAPAFGPEAFGRHVAKTVKMLIANATEPLERRIAELERNRK